MIFGIALINNVIKAAAIIVPYTGQSTPVPSDIAETFQNSITLYSWLYIVLGAADAAFAFIGNSCCTCSAQKVINGLNIKTMTNLLMKAGLEDQEKFPQSYILTALQLDSETVKEAIGMNTAYLMLYSANFTVALIYSFTIGKL